MRRVILEGGRRLTQADLNRAGALPADVIAAAENIVDDVRARGDAAVRECCLRFDGACPDEFRVPDGVVSRALDLVDPEFVASLERARDQIRDFHERGYALVPDMSDASTLVFARDLKKDNE